MPSVLNAHNDPAHSCKPTTTPVCPEGQRPGPQSFIKPIDIQVQEMAAINRLRCQHLLITLITQRGATFAYQSNIEGEMIKLMGGWASDAYKRYIDVSMDKRYESMKQFVEALSILTAE